MRNLILGGLALALAGCSSGGDNSFTLVKAAWNEIFPGDKDKPAKPGPTLTRAAVEKSGAAMIRTRLVEENVRPVLSAAAQHGPYVTYVSRLGQSLTLRGSLITGTRGLGYDLLSVATGPNDPVTRAIPLQNWPAQVTRTYRFPGRGPGGVARTVTCTYQPGEPREIEIVEVVHSGIQVAEHCAGDGVSFTNYHLADRHTGFVWRSIQWLGPDQGAIDLEVIEPFTGD